MRVGDQPRSTVRTDGQITLRRRDPHERCSSQYREPRWCEKGAMLQNGRPFCSIARVQTLEITDLRSIAWCEMKPFCSTKIDFKNFRPVEALWREPTTRSLPSLPTFRTPSPIFPCPLRNFKDLRRRHVSSSEKQGTFCMRRLSSSEKQGEKAGSREQGVEIGDGLRSLCSTPGYPVAGSAPRYLGVRITSSRGSVIDSIAQRMPSRPRPLSLTPP